MTGPLSSFELLHPNGTRSFTEGFVASLVKVDCSTLAEGELAYMIRDDLSYINIITRRGDVYINPYDGFFTFMPLEGSNKLSVRGYVTDESKSCNVYLMKGSERFGMKFFDSGSLGSYKVECGTKYVMGKTEMRITAMRIPAFEVKTNDIIIEHGWQSNFFVEIIVYEGDKVIFNYDNHIRTYGSDRLLTVVRLEKIGE